MNLGSQLRFFPLNRFTFIRFGLVSLFGEAIYFLLYGLVLYFSSSTSISLAIAGGICVLLNAYGHSRVTFRVRFTKILLFGYLLIQILGFGIAFLIGLVLDGFGTNKWVIALVTYACWAIVSYLLSKILYRSEARKQKLSHTPTEHRQP
jgi:putative flippase GtrA